MTLLTLDVMFRVANKPIPGLTTLGVLVLLAVVYLGMARCEEMEEHTTVDILTTRLPARWKNINCIFVNVLKLIAVTVLLYVSVINLAMSYSTQESFADVVRLPIWPSKLAVAIGAFFFAVQVVCKLVDSIVVYVSEMRQNKE
ncbi:MAG: TRAP transporter small permease subunit [Desulfofundulus sp.]